MVFQAVRPADRRTAQRYSCHSAARVRTQSFDFPCRIVDISVTGAKIAIAPTLGTSFREDHWDLVVDDLGRIPAQKVWQRGFEVGLVFVNSPGKQFTLERTMGDLVRTGALRPLSD